MNRIRAEEEAVIVKTDWFQRGWCLRILTLSWPRAGAVPRAQSCPQVPPSLATKSTKSHKTQGGCPRPLSPHLLAATAVPPAERGSSRIPVRAAWPEGSQRPELRPVGAPKQGGEGRPGVTSRKIAAGFSLEPFFGGP